MPGTAAVRRRGLTSVRQIMWWTTKRPPTVWRPVPLGVDVVEFLDLQRRDIPIFGEPRRCGAESRPTNRAQSPFTRDFGQLDDQIGRADASTTCRRR